MRAWFALALLLVAIVPPAVALANGPSAGDNQYTDPLGGGTKTTKSTTPATTAPTTTPAAQPTTTIAPSTGTTGSLSSSPTLATSASSSTTSSSSDSGSLPVTGFDAWLGFAVGAGLVGVGFAVRRRISLS
jgi:cobalamin biosynthesis Mg chelatase CobN